MPGSPKTSLSFIDHFLEGGGTMAELIRSKNWSATPLGPIEEWPQSLRTTVSLCLASNFPINLIWGPEHIQIYNDGYRPICAGKHPKSLGEDYTQTWASAWDILADAFERALAGETSFLENQRMFLDRNGYLEETFFTFSLSPIRDESGEIGGLFHPVTETTAQMLSQRRTRALQDLASRASQSKSVEEACQSSMQALSDYQFDLPFGLIYLLDPEAKQARLAGAAHLAPGGLAGPEAIDLSGYGHSVWPLAETIDASVSLEVNSVVELFGPLPCGPYPESPHTAFVLPILTTGMERSAGVLVLGVSPRLPFTAAYRVFLDLIATGVTSAIVNARAYEEERKRAEKLAELDKAKTTFFSNVSHEFRTPLTLMLGPLEEMLNRAGEKVAAERDSVELIHRNGLRLLRLVNTLLDFSRIEANRSQASYEPTDLAAVTADLASLFRAAIEKAGMALRVEAPAISEPVYVDREMWEKIVLNLLSNAFKFTFEGAITVTLRELSSHVELMVSDTGTGIPAQDLPQLFKRFHRVQGAKGRSYEGTGIGLALVEDLVKLHGGSVQVQSKLKEGTTFRVTIPKGFRHLPSERVSRTPASGAVDITAKVFVEEALRWLPSEQLNGHAKRPENNTLTTKRRMGRILLADDNADMRQYIQNILSSEFEIEAVPDGAKALQAIQEQIPDLVLTDVMMPEMDGFALLKELRSDRRMQAVPVIMLSARAGEEARLEGLEAGVDDYLVKPFNARELLARVRVNLELSRLRNRLSREEEERHGAEEMKRQWRLFDTALSHTPDSIYIFDAEGRLVYANRALLERWKQSLPEVLGKNLIELEYPSALAGKIQGQFQKVLEDGVPVRDEASLNDRDGQTRNYDYTFVPVFSNSGTIEAVAGSTWDVTEHRESNRALREANADLEQFAFSASHDLQEPLRMVAIYTQLLKRKYGGQLDSQADTIIEQCVNGAVRMEELIKDLLAFTRASTGPTILPEPVSLERVFDNTLESLQAAIQETNAVITRTPLPAIRVQAVHLQQVFQNLIGNALKYRSDRQPEVHVSAKRAGGEWILSVRDNGIGIAPHYKEHIFGLFKRLHSGSQYSGTGLGLAICKKLVERYGGRIWLDSTTEGGSTFLFSFPAQESL